MLGRMSAASRACRARGLRRTTPTHGQTGSTTPQQTAGRPIRRVASWTGKSSDTHHLLRTSSRGCHEDAARKKVPWNLSLTDKQRGNYCSRGIYPPDRGHVCQPRRQRVPTAAQIGHNIVSGAGGAPASRPGQDTGRDPSS